MKLTLNNRIEILESDSMTIRDLMVYKKFSYKKIMVKLNGKIIDEENYETVQLQENDNLMIIHLMAGG